MANRLIGSNLKAIGVLWNFGTFSSLDDRALLARFVGRVEGSGNLAFEVLVRRHGPMVLGVCQTLLGNRHAAEDAFQAVFLVLARKARSIQKPEQLGPWLYGVALKTAKESRKREERQRRLERRAPEMQSAAVIPPDHALLKVEAAEALHREIARLPERYRVAVVLCDLEGLTHQEAASQLGCPTGTIAVRIKRARERLKERLERRGLTPSNACLMLAASRSAMSPTLIESTVRASLASGLASASVVSLAEGVRMTMILAKAKTATTAMVLALALAATWEASGGFAGSKPDDPARLLEKAVGRAVLREIRDFEDFNGVSKASRQQTVQTHSGGRIEKVNVVPGARVKANDVLAEVDPKPLEAALTTAEAEVKRAEAQQTLAKAVQSRNKALRKKDTKFVSQEEADKADAELLAIQLVVARTREAAESARLALPETRIKAPFDGVVVECKAELGNRLNAGDAVATIIVLDPIAVAFPVDERTILKLRRLYGDDKKTIENLTIRVRFPFVEDQEFSDRATLDALPIGLDPTTGTAQFQVTIPNLKNLRLNMMVQVRMWFGQPHEAILIPEAAIATEGNRKFVYILDDHDVVTSRPIQTGQSHDGLRVILEGLQAGDRVVVGGLAGLKSGMTIKPKVEAKSNR